jgi:mono/diheme cytochrome c family protein
VNRFVLLALRALAGYMVLPAAGISVAGPESRPIVAGFERFYSGTNADAVRGGQLLLSELSCLSCHASGATGATGVVRKQPPVLDGVAGRVRIGWLRKFLADPQVAKPGTTMPGLFVGDPERDRKVEALVHLLASTGPLKVGHSERKRIPVGRDLYHKVGCVACHGSRDASKAEVVVASSVPLGDVTAKYSYDGLSSFLENPLRSRPSGRMPKLLSAAEAKAVAGFLLQGSTPPARGSTNFAYYEGSWDRVPDFSTLKPVSSGTVPGFELTVARRNDNYAIHFEGFFEAERSGMYSFTLTSDDGSRLYVDGQSVVDNDGIHPPQLARGSVKLSTGIHKVAVAYFQGGGGAELEVTIVAPGAGKIDLGDVVAPAPSILENKPKPNTGNDPDALQPDPELVKKGRALFAAVGCASCHRLSEGSEPIPSALKAPPLDQLKVGAGCLSSAPIKSLPWYQLGAIQRRALDAAIASPPPVVARPADIIDATMVAFNCYACHIRGKKGGPEPSLDRFVQTTQPEMGEEGRVPPPLDGVGAKLDPVYLRELLDKGAHHRPYMHTHMPGFGIANVGTLVEAFAAVDHLAQVPAVSFSLPIARVKDAARHLVGGQAFGCIKCHTFGGIKAEGVQGIDMTLMARRLQRSWFHAYLLDPPSIRPGTRMPTAFFQGKSALPDVLDGKPATQIEAMWVYLADGTKSRPPAGIGGQSIPLVPEHGAIIYRNFIEGAGPRAIAVGYPEKVNLAFDANEMRLAMYWQGAFIDAGRHWTDRGAGFEAPAGDNVLHLPAGVAFAVLTRSDEPWPTASPKELGYRFLGYRLTPDDRPTFRYAMRELVIEDSSNPIASTTPGFRRSLEISAGKVPGDVFFRAALADKIENSGDSTYRMDSAWSLKVEGVTGTFVRKVNGKTELLVPLRFSASKARLVLEYRW